MSRLLVDTNVIFWMLVSDRGRLTDAARDALASERNAIYVSAISVFEIAVKRSLGRLQIGSGWARSLPAVGLEPLPATALHAEAVEQLPWHHRDPFDRLLVAQAKVEEMALVSADRRFGTYDVEVIW